MAFARLRVITRPVLFVALLLTLLMTVSGPVAAATTEYDRVRTIAKNQIGDPWVWGKTGPDQFDCVGFVYYVYRQAGVLDRIGGQWRGVRGYWDWFAARGRASRYNGRRGDLIIWGNAKHIGIYLGDGRAISALTSGVKIHGLHNLTSSFTTFLHVRLER